MVVKWRETTLWRLRRVVAYQVILLCWYVLAGTSLAKTPDDFPECCLHSSPLYSFGFSLPSSSYKSWLAVHPCVLEDRTGKGWGFLLDSQGYFLHHHSPYLDPPSKVKTPSWSSCKLVCIPVYAFQWLPSHKLRSISIFHQELWLRFFSFEKYLLRVHHANQYAVCTKMWKIWFLSLEISS